MRTTMLAFTLALVMLAAASAVGKKPPAQPVDLNRASVEELMRLPGVGKRKAERIVEQRKVRPYKRTSDILFVPGFGRHSYAKLRPYLRVDPPASPAAPATTPAPATPPVAAAVAPLPKASGPSRP